MGEDPVGHHLGYGLDLLIPRNRFHAIDKAYQTNLQDSKGYGEAHSDWIGDDWLWLQFWSMSDSCA